MSLINKYWVRVYIVLARVVTYTPPRDARDWSIYTRLAETSFDEILGLTAHLKRILDFMKSSTK